MSTILSIIIVCVILGIIAIYIFNYSPVRKQNIRDLYTEGLDLLIAGRRKEAYRNFKSIIDKDTNSIGAYIKLGQVVREGGNPKQALKIHKFLVLRKNLTKYEKVELHKNISLDYYKLNEINLSISECEKVLKIDKLNEWALSNLVKFHIESYNWQSAGSFLKRLQDLKKTPNFHQLALFKIQEGRSLVQKGEYQDARNAYESALNFDNELMASYYFIGNSYSAESGIAYQDAVKAGNSTEDGAMHMERARQLLSKAIPMWIRYCEGRPEQSWMVIQLIKDALFELDRYSEFENILKNILQEDDSNIDAIANLADIYAQRGELNEAVDLIDSKLNNDDKSLLVKLIRLKLEMRRGQSNQDILNNLDEIIHFLVTDEQFQKYKNSNRDSDIVWLYENGKEKIDL